MHFFNVQSKLNDMEEDDDNVSVNTLYSIY